MSWRRFRVLFEGVFTWNEPEAVKAQRIADTVDWDRVQHRPVPDIMAPQFPGNRVEVSKQ